MLIRSYPVICNALTHCPFNGKYGRKHSHILRLAKCFHVKPCVRYSTQVFGGSTPENVREKLQFYWAKSHAFKNSGVVDQYNCSIHSHSLGTNTLCVPCCGMTMRIFVPEKFRCRSEAKISTVFDLKILMARATHLRRCILLFTNPNLPKQALRGFSLTGD